MKTKKHRNHTTRQVFSCFHVFLLSVLSVFLSLFAFTFSAKAISINPVRQTVVIDPGKNATVSLKIKNDSDESSLVTFEVDAFNIEKNTGHPVFGAGDQAKSWITVPDQISLPANKEREARFVIHVPERAEAGGHYLGLFVKSAPAAGQVGIASRVGTLLFLYVGGTVEESLARREFSTDKSWYLRPPVHLSLQFENVGTVHAVPQGAIFFRRDSGSEIARMPLNPSQKKVLPGGFWREEYALRKLGLRDIGHVTAVAAVSYGVTSQTMTDTIAFWYIPLPIAAALFGFVALITLGIFLIRFGRRHSI